MNTQFTTTYINQITDAWRRSDAPLLSNLLSLRHEHVRNGTFSDTYRSSYMAPPLAEIVNAHINCVKAMKASNYSEAFDNQYNLANCVNKIFQTHRESNWFLPVIYTVCLDLRLLASYAQSSSVEKAETSVTIKPREVMEKTADALMATFRICAADSRTSELYTKKWGMMYLANQLFKVYFKINKINLMKPLLRAIDSSPFKNRFRLSEMVTYKYYAGRKAVYESDYKTANELLTYAFERCLKTSQKNKRLILIYLIPIRILLGYMPVKWLLEKYNLLCLWEIAQAVRDGRIKELIASMTRNHDFLVNYGIYMIVEKLKMITYRNLFKKVYLLNNNHVLELNTLLVALQMVEGPEIDLEDTHCILANLIYDGKIKGYISLSHQKVVFSKLDAFPKLCMTS